MTRRKFFAAGAILTLPVVLLLQAGGNPDKATSPGTARTAARTGKPAYQWSREGVLLTARSGACAAVLPDGAVLVTGGHGNSGTLSSAEIFSASGSINATAPMSESRANHACAVLKNGLVLVAGGSTSGGGTTNAAELYDPQTRSWSFAEPMTLARAGATASALPDGRVLIAGGEVSGTASATLEIFDPETRAFHAVEQVMSSPRKEHAAAVLRDGRVLLAGGSDGDHSLDTVDVYDPATGTVSLLGRLSAARAGLSATTLLDGRVYFAGGRNQTADLASAEVYDPARDSFAEAAPMSAPRRGHLAIRIPNNNSILLAGGTSNGEPSAAAELFIPWWNSYKQLPSLPGGRVQISAAALDKQGAVMLAGGSNQPLAYSEQTATVMTVAVPTVTTDKSDYHPGESVTLSGANWKAGEVITFNITRSPNPRTLQLTTTADANGNFVYRPSELVMTTDDIGQTYTINASGNQGSTAQAITFTDAVNIDTHAANCGGAAVLTFTLGDTVCATASGLGSTNITIQWFNPSNILKRTSVQSGGGNFSDSYIPDSTGSWTVKAVQVTNGVVLASSTFTVLGCTAPTVTTNPTDQTVSLGGNATLTAAASGTSPSVQWQVSTDGGATFTNITTATNTTLTVSSVTAAQNGNKYRAVFTNSCGTATSTAAMLNVTVAITVNTTTDGSASTRSITVDGSTSTGPQTFNWIIGTSHTIDVTDPQSGGTGIRFVWTSWSGTPNNATKFQTITAPSSTATYTANFKTQYQLTFTQSGIGGDSTGTVVTVAGNAKTAGDLPFSDWFDAGSGVTYSYTDPVPSSVSGKRYTLTTPAPAPASPITVSASATVTGTYKTQYHLTFSQSGIGGDSSGTVVTVAGNAKSAANLPFSDWFDSGSSVTYLYSDPVASTVTGKRYALTTPAAAPASPISVSASATVTGTYKTQFQITFTQSGIGGDSTGTVATVAGNAKTMFDLPFSDWFDSGSSVTYLYSDPVASTVTGKRYALTTPAATPVSPISVSGSVTVIGTYKMQFQITFKQSGINGDSTGTVVTAAGVPKTAGDLPFTTDWLDSGSTITFAYADPVASSVAGKRYSFLSADASSPLTVSGPTIVTGSYKTQFQITFTQSGIGGDSTGTVVTVNASAKSAANLPFSDWFDSGSSVSYLYSDPLASTVPGKRYALTVPVPTPASPITVSSPVTVTGTYKTQFQITFTQSGIGGDSTGTVVTVNASAKSAGNLPFSDWFDSGSSVSYAYSDPVASSATGKRYALTTPAATPSNPISVSASITVTGTYKAQFQITFKQSGINGDSTGTVVTVASVPKTAGDLPFTTDWLDSGSTLTFAYADPVASSVAGKRYAFLSADATSPLTVSGPNIVTGSYKVQFQLTFAQSGIGVDSTGTVMTVNASAKSAGNLPFSDWFDSGSSVFYTYSDPVASTITGKRYALTTPAPTPPSPITVAGSVTVTGTYKTQFQITFAQSGIGGDSTGTVVTVNASAKTAANLPFADWFDSGASVAYAYSDPVASTVAGKRYVLTAPTPTPTNPIAVSGSVTVTGTYKTQFQVTFKQTGVNGDSMGTVVTVAGVLKTAGDLPFTTDWLDNGSTLTFGYADPLASSVAGKRYALVSVDATSALTISAPSTVTGTYKIQFQLTFAQSGIGGDSTGTVVTVGGNTKTMADLPFSNWFDNGSSVAYSYSDPVASSVTGKRYALTTPVAAPASPITVSGSVTVTGTYKVQYMLTLSVTSGVPSGLSNITGGTTGTYYDSGSALTLVAATPVSDPPGRSWRFNNWTGTTTGSAATLNVTMLSAQTLTANYVVPVLTAAVNQAALEGTPTLVDLGAFTENGVSGPWSIAVSWGDNSANTVFSTLSTGPITSQSHTFVDNVPLTYTVTIKVTDVGGAYDTKSFTVTVTNVAPTIASVTGPPPVSLGGSATVVANFTDPGAVDTHTCTFSWGDPTAVTTVNASGSGNGSCSAPHTYTAVGVYTVTVTVTDKDGGNATTQYEYVVIYDPNAGFVTGGGWINSPAGAYPANPALTGRANFGFVSKYKKGQSTPDGNTEFQFQAAGFNFHSTSYEWLTVAGAKAMYKGSGTINGSGDYFFLLSAIDGAVNGGGGVDRFRLKVWDKTAAANVLYDNQIGAGDTADPTTAIGGGSIVIHQ